MNSLRWNRSWIRRSIDHLTLRRQIDLRMNGVEASQTMKGSMDHPGSIYERANERLSQASLHKVSNGNKWPHTADTPHVISCPARWTSEVDESVKPRHHARRIRLGLSSDR